ncbi:MAG: D-aminoacyl-tRNA deacylase [Lysobacterales bacterium]
MIALLQRVAEAAVRVNKNFGENFGENLDVTSRSTTEISGRIGPGMLALIGIERGDGEEQLLRLLQRVLAWRMFADAAGKMNLNLAQSGGGLLLVPQFTLAADTGSGNRPSFTHAAPPDEGELLFNRLVEAARQQCKVVETGVFGADMQVGLVNDGPVTFWLQVRPGS